jgi:hypothetical protein
MSNDVRFWRYWYTTLQLGGKTRLNRAEQEISCIALMPPQSIAPERPFTLFKSTCDKAEFLMELFSVMDWMTTEDVS